jgi:hypothetical protein
VGTDRSQKPIRYTFFIEEDGDLRARFVVDSRRYESVEAARDAAHDAYVEIGRRRLVGERERRNVNLTDPFSRLPEWSEYKLDIDAKHPLPEHLRAGSDEEPSES